MGFVKRYSICTLFILFAVSQKGATAEIDLTKHAREQISAGRRQMFLDDAMIESMDGLRRVINSPRKYEHNPVIKIGSRPWQSFRAQVYGTALYFPDEKKFKMWYLAGPRFPWEKPVRKDQRMVVPNYQFTAYAESIDGFRWALPDLGLVAFDGSKKNNICRMATECAEGVAVVYDKNDSNLNRRYKALYWEHSVPYQGNVVKTINGISVAFSADGKDWAEHPSNPVIGQGSDTGQQALWDPDRGVFRALGRFGAGGRRVAMSESKDFINWTKSQLVFQADAKDGNNIQIYGMGTTFYEGLFIGLPWMYHIGTSEQIDVQLSVSRDCVNWQRVANRETFIPNGKLGEWDEGIIFTASQPLQVVGDTVFIFYSGTSDRHNADLKKHYFRNDSEAPRRALQMPSIGVATIRRDGFVSLDAGASHGRLVTKPFDWPTNRSLYVNVDVSRGDLAIELLGKSGKAVAIAAPITGDRLRMKVDLPQSLTRQQRANARVRFTLRNGKFFSYWFE